MLLSDTFQTIIDAVDITNEASIRDAIQQMVNAGFKNISEEGERCSSNENVVVLFKRLNTIWNFSKKYADKNGKPFMKENGIRELILHDEKFKILHDKI